jgi:uncharacterized protein with HEPN domain
MKNPDIRVYIQDMKTYAKQIFELTENFTIEQFEADLKTRLAVERLFEIIGEAANRIPIDFQQNYPLIPWSNVIGLRNIIAHGYDIVHPGRLFAVIENDLDNLIKELDKIPE